MEDVTRRAARLLEEAQTGNAAQALAAAETQLRAATGELVDGPAAIHFPRLVALIMLGEQRRAIGSVDLMLAAADREGSAGWRSCALSLRAVERLRLGEAEVAEHDVDAVLRDLAAAEAALTGGEPDPVIAANAHTGVALGYHQLRLYELAVPQYEAAYEISIRHPDHGGNRAMWLCNLANLHLQWALELYQVGDVVQAEAHTAEAERYATRAMAEASGPDAAAHRDTAGLYAACARADREDPAGAAADIIGYLALAAERGISPAAVAFAHPFHAVAVSRAGQRTDHLCRDVRQDL
ncbi:MAG TPA: GGDEF domain-containing protein, partial [Pilimelia sp.]|nr:GGDEF domain-containing protein [Pilimelia sp.]